MNNHAPHKLTLGPRNIFWIALSIAVLALVAYVIKSEHQVTGISVPGVLDVTLGGDQGKGPQPALIPEVPQAAEAGVVQQNRLDTLTQQELKLKQLELQEKIAQMEARLKDSESQSRTSDSAIVPPAPTINLSGIWIGDDGVQYNFTQVGDEITFQEMNPLFGVTAVAEGDIVGNQVNLQYSTMLGSTGEGELLISANGRRLTGSLYDNTFDVATSLALSR